MPSKELRWISCIALQSAPNKLTLMLLNTNLKWSTIYSHFNKQYPWHVSVEPFWTPAKMYQQTFWDWSIVTRLRPWQGRIVKIYSFIYFNTRTQNSGLLASPSRNFEFSRQKSHGDRSKKLCQSHASWYIFNIFITNVICKFGIIRKLKIKTGIFRRKNFCCLKICVHVFCTPVKNQLLLLEFLGSGEHFLLTQILIRKLPYKRLEPPAFWYGTSVLQSCLFCVHNASNFTHSCSWQEKKSYVRHKNRQKSNIWIFVAIKNSVCKHLASILSKVLKI